MMFPFYVICVKTIIFSMPKNITGKGIYEVKPSYYKEYTPFFYHYAKTEQAKVSHFQLIKLSSLLLGKNLSL